MSSLQTFDDGRFAAPILTQDQRQGARLTRLTVVEGDDLRGSRHGHLLHNVHNALY